MARWLLVVLTVLGALAPVSFQAALAEQERFVHAPVTTAAFGAAVPLSVNTRCVSADCSLTLLYRSTPEGTLTAGGFQLQPATRGATTPLPTGEFSVAWSTAVPAEVVNTRGVDYSFELSDGTALHQLPGNALTRVGSTARPLYFHVAVVSPPRLAHVPPAYATADRDLELTAEATCASGACEARIYYRATPEGVAVLDDDLFSPPDWDSVAMSGTVGLVDPVYANERISFTGAVPGSAVDLYGVDYAIVLQDGHTSSWFPGTTYVGAYAAADGFRTSYHHLHVLEPARILHTPPPPPRYRTDLPITARATCPQSRTCTAELYYRITPPGLSLDTGFRHKPMTVTRVGTTNGVDDIRVSSDIPKAFVDTRGIDYFFRVEDGTTRAWYPGTSSIDGYVALNGIRVLHQHVEVQSPPKVLPLSMPVAEAGKDYKVQARSTCATDSCVATLHYTDNSSAANGATSTVGVSGAPTVTLGLSNLNTRPYADLTMQQTAKEVTLTGDPVLTFEATIPAEDVTSRGLALYVHVFDGFTNGYGPGTSYSGTGLALDGTSPRLGLVDLSMPVSVLAPPALVPAPLTTTTRDRAIPVIATGPCADTACSAHLQYQPADGEWFSRGMRGTRSGIGPDGVALWTFRGTIPASATASDSVRFRVIADDGSSRTTTPALTVPLQSADGALITGRVFFDQDGDKGLADEDVLARGVLVTLRSATPTVGTLLPPVTTRTDYDGAFEFGHLPAGPYKVAVDPSSLPAGTGSAAASAISVELAEDEHRLDAHFVLPLLDSDSDGLPDLVEGRIGTDPAGGEDSDRDGLTDLVEIAATGATSSPARADSDEDGVADPQEDPDGDGLSVLQEVGRGTDPLLADSDDDGSPDALETTRGTNPLLADSDGDGLLDGNEVRTGSNPRLSDTDGDGVPDAQEQYTTSKTVGDVGVAVNGRGDLAGALRIAPLASEPIYDPAPGKVGDPVEINLAPERRADFTSAKISLPYPAGYATPEDLRLFTLDTATQVWAPASAAQSVDTKTRRVHATVDHFSTYAVFDAKKWAAEWLSLSATDDRAVRPLDFALVIDSSGSMTTYDPQDLRKSSSSTLIDLMSPRDQSAVVDFDHAAKLLKGLTGQQGELKAAVTLIDSDGGTDLAVGVREALDELDRTPGAQRRAVLLLTDGIGPWDPALVARARATNTTIFTIGLGSDIDSSLLQQIASDTGGRYYPIAEALDLNETSWQIDEFIKPDDRDHDGLPDVVERNGFRESTTGRLIKTDPTRTDSDSDGLPDGDEVGDPIDLGNLNLFGQTLSELKGVVVRQMLSDPNTADSDGDTLSDLQEQAEGTAPRAADGDGDSLTDRRELRNNTDPNDLDTDADGHQDDFEVQHRDEGYDPLEFTRTTSKLRWVTDFLLGGTCGDLFGLCARDSMAWLTGNIASGLLIFGDIRDAIGSIFRLDVIGAAASAVFLVPGVGDGASVVGKVTKHVSRYPEKLIEVAHFVARQKKFDDDVKEKILRRLGRGTFDKLYDLGIQPNAIARLAGGKQSLRALVKAIEASGGTVKRGPFLPDGPAGEAHLRNLATDEPTTSLITFTKPDGAQIRRFIDIKQARVPMPKAREVKVGFEGGRERVTKELANDLDLLRANKLSSLDWDFLPSSVSNTVGPGPTLLKRLQDAKDEFPDQFNFTIYLPTR